MAESESGSIRLFFAAADGADDIEPLSANDNQEVLRRRVVGLEGDAVRMLAGLRQEDSGIGVLLRLFSDVSLRGRVTEMSRNESGATTVSGEFEEQAGNFTFVHWRTDQEVELILGDLVHRGREFEIRPLENGLYEVLEINPFAPKPCVVVNESKRRIEATSGIEEQVIAATPGQVDVVDVLVVYTSATLAAADGSVQKLEALIDLGASKLNTALRTSETECQVRVVAKMHIPWWLEGNDTLSNDLTALRNSRQIQDLRRQHRADQVTLIRAPDGINYGIAFCMGETPVGFKDSCMSVIDYAHIARYAVFGHELGHCLGCDHNRSSCDCCNTRYAYGQWFYGDSGTQWGTMMSYVGARILNFSNPAVNYDGQPTGLAGVRDNARRIRETKATVARYF